MTTRGVIAILSLAALAACQSPERRAAREAERERPFYDVPLLQAEDSGRGRTALLRQVGQNGTVATWLTVDGVSISLDRGVLVASRGLGHDLMAADAAPTLAALAAGGGGPYRRQLRYLTGDDKSAFLVLACRMDPGPDPAAMEETCEAPGLRLANLYRLGLDGQILSSRQWLSPEVGWLDLRPFGTVPRPDGASENLP